MKTAKANQESFTLCTYCPSLCRHACPVAATEGRDTVSPWGLMSMAGHLGRGDLRLSEELAEILYHCTGCGACTDVCLHQVPVAAALMDARAEVVARGRVAIDPRELVQRYPGRVSSKRATGQSKTPGILVLPGHRSVPPDGDEVRLLLKLAERLGEDSLGISPTSWLDTGASLWQAGYREGFRRFAMRMREELNLSRHVVVLSGEAYWALRTIYPKEGGRVSPEVLHVSEFLLPLLYGDGVKRLNGTYGVMRSCRLKSREGRLDVQTELLSRVLEEPVVDLSQEGSEFGCCGGGGCLPYVAPETTQGTAQRIITRALALNLEHLITFTPECASALREVAPASLEVLSVVELVDRAVPEGHS